MAGAGLDYAIQLNSILEPGCMDPGRLGGGGRIEGLVSPERLAFRMALAGLEPGQAWGFKDPRNGLTAEAWLAAFPHARIVHLVRDPAATLGTLPELYGRYVRLGAERPTATRFWIDLWEAYVDGARRAMAAAEASAELRFEDLCADPAGVLGRVAEAVGLDVEVTPDRLSAVPIETGKADLRREVRSRLAPAEVQALEALAARYGYPG